MANANDLPQDLWELISFHLAWRMRRSLIGLNRQMMNIVLDERYRIVSWTDPNAAMILRRIERLCVPAIASHVRCLHIPAWSMKVLLNMPLDTLEGAAYKPPDSKARRPLLKLGQLLDARSWFGRDQSTQRGGKPSPRSFRKIADDNESVMAAMHKAMGLMINLREFRIEWRNLPLPLAARSFLSSLNDAFRNKLCRLVLGGTSMRVEEMMSGLITPPYLEELDLRLDFNSKGEKSDMHNKAMLVNVVAPYINALKQTLHTLKITSHASGDHAPFFQALRELPTLRKLVLQIPIESHQLSEISHLLAFLRLHTFQLHLLELIPHRDDSGAVSQNWPPFHQKLTSLDPWFPNLNSLSITSSSPSDTLSLVQRLPTSITNLRFAHRYYEPQQVMALIKAISSHVYLLDTLSIEIVQLTIELLKSMAAAFPALYSLTVVVEIDSNPFPQLYGLQNLQDPPRIPIDWNISDLGIYIKNYRDNSRSRLVAEDREYTLMKGVQQSIPSIKSFRGKGHTMSSDENWDYFRLRALHVSG